MEPMTMASLAQLALAGLQGTLAGTVKLDRPTYQAPNALTQMVKQTEREATASQMPGQAQMQDRIRSNTSNTLSRLQSNAVGASDILNGVSAAQVQENRSMTDLYLQSLSYKDGAKMRHQQSLAQLANAQDKEWQINQQQPYLDSAQTKAALYRSSLLTGFDSLSNLAAIAQMNQNQGQPKQPITLPSAPQPQGYNLSEIVNMNANDSWRALQERMIAGLNL